MSTKPKRRLVKGKDGKDWHAWVWKYPDGTWACPTATCCEDRPDPPHVGMLGKWMRVRFVEAKL